MQDVAYRLLWDESEARRAELCRAFYTEVYREAFPHADQAEDPENWLPLMRPDPRIGKPSVYMIVACAPETRTSGETVLGGVIFEHYHRSGYWLATYIAVHPGMRGHGVAAKLFRRMVAAIGAFAETGSWQLLAEAEDPRRFQTNERVAANRRLSVLMALGLERLPIDYVQPALAADKRPLHDLLLLCWKRPGGPGPTAEGLAAFLREFYAALDQPGAAALDDMLSQLSGDPEIETRPLPVPARYDGILGHADAITLRITFVSHHVRQHGTRDANAPYGGEIPLDRVRPDRKTPKDAHKEWRLLTSQFGSFNADIIIPFASASSLPAILQCEPFRKEPDGVAGTRAPLAVKIAFPSVLEMEWEGEVRTFTFSDQGEAAWTIDALLVDSVAIFESGYLTYSIALVFQTDSGRRPTINATAILALGSIAEPAGHLIGEPVRIGTDALSLLPIHEFLRRRLRDLDAGDHGSTTIFSALRRVEDPDLRQSLRECLLGMTFYDPTRPDIETNTKVSLSLEIIGADRHDAVIHAAAEAAARTAPVTAFTLRLAGLAQNVLDFQEQDDVEVHDSLAGGCMLGSEMTFAHRDLTIRFSRFSRAFSEMWAVTGGEPYWFLVELILSHNARLLADLNEDIRRDQGATGLTGLMMSLLTRPATLSSPDDRADARRRLQRTQGRRIRLAHYIPNLFRYPTERALFQQFIEAKGLVIQRDYFVQLEETMEKMVREIAVLETGISEADDRAAENRRHVSDERRDRLLVTIGVVQTTGVFAAFASVFAAIAALNHDDIQGFFSEVAGELDIGMVAGPLLKHLPNQIRSIAGNGWPLILSLGLITASLSFIAAVGLIYWLRRVGVGITLIVAVIALVAPAVLTLLVWILTEEFRLPALVILLLLGLCAGAAPGALYLLWSRGERKAGRE